MTPEQERMFNLGVESMRSRTVAWLTTKGQMTLGIELMTLSPPKPSLPEGMTISRTNDPPEV